MQRALLHPLAALAFTIIIPIEARPDLIVQRNPASAFVNPLQLTFDNQGSPAFADGTISSAPTGTALNHFIDASNPNGQLVNRFTTTDTRFQQFGIASISVLQANAGQVPPGIDFNEANNGPGPRGEGRGLFFDGTRFLLDTFQANVTTGRQFFLRPEFTIDLLGAHQQFGFSFADRSDTTMRVEAYWQGTLVDAVTFTYSEAAAPQNTTAPDFLVVSVAQAGQFFDRVLIYQPTPQSDNGWGIDNLTVEATAVPEPASLLLTALASAAGAAYVRFRRSGRTSRTCPSENLRAGQIIG